MESQTLPGYGQMLADKLRSNLKGAPSDLERFILDCGYKYDTQDALEAAYDRKYHADHDVLLTLDEFMAESGKNYDVEVLKAVYDKLKEFYELHRLTARELYNFARFKWCLKHPEAIISCQVDKQRWFVNNCDTEISIPEARIRINDMFGFEASGIKITGTPYYAATDYQFIRFWVRDIAWLYCNDDLFRVLE
jgi:hypothetical protein